MRAAICVLMTWLVLAGSAWAAADLAIGDDEVYRRPNAWSQNENGLRDYAHAASRTGVSIAWRNANQIEEVEVRVINLGDVEGRGRLSVDIVDAEGRVLLSLTAPAGQEIISVPAADDGGRQGRVLRMQASWELNGLIDRFDIADTQYGVMATIEPIGEDADLSNNRKTKTWHNIQRVTPGGVTTFNYVFRNFERETRSFAVRLETSDLPNGWHVTNRERTRRVTLSPGETFSGTLELSVPDNLENGAFAEIRLALADPATGRVYRQHEWFEVYDVTPPEISNYRAIMLADHTIAIQALVADQHSGVMEATGVSTEYSVDGGRTWARKAHNYKTGNFVRPTLFETVLGPFPPGTEVWLRMSARDTAGNASMVIPDDATAYLAPAGAEQLVQLAYIFPRTQANPIFEIEELRALSEAVRNAQSQGFDVSTMSVEQLPRLGLAPARVRELGIDTARFTDLRSDIQRLGLLNFDFGAIAPVELVAQRAPGESVLRVNTFSVRAQ